MLVREPTEASEDKVERQSHGGAFPCGKGYQAKEGALRLTRLCHLTIAYAQGKDILEILVAHLMISNELAL